MTNSETIFFWLATLALAAAFFLAAVALVFRQAAPQRWASRLLTAAIVPLLGLGVTRWVRTGHPPFVTLFESMVFSVLLLVLFFQFLRWRRTFAGFAQAPAAGIALLLMGWSLTVPHEASPLSAALDNVWLFIHASFATAGAATFLIAAAFAAAYLLGPDRLSRLTIARTLTADVERIPRSITTHLLLGFIMWGTMIASGAIWAHVAWGRYWGWDPIELWSLISWILYALLIHARMTLHLRVKIFCVLAIVTAVVVAFSLWGIQYVYETIHSYG
jgi:ABC-type transport system involved in cytochrome c biogenesis permease subunit